MITKKTTSGIGHLDIISADIRSLIDNKQDFLGFVIISLGIEFLGAFFDDKAFNEFGQSDIRFKNALSRLFKKNWYKNNKDWMFKNFRGPLIHQYRTGDDLLLTSYCKNNANLNLHLKEIDGKRIMVLEELFNDFCLAVEKLKNEIKKPTSTLNKQKIQSEFMSIIEISPLKTEENTNESVEVSGTSFNGLARKNK